VFAIEALGSGFRITGAQLLKPCAISLRDYCAHLSWYMLYRLRYAIWHVPFVNDIKPP